MTKPIYNYLCEKMVQKKLFTKFMSSFFVQLSYKIVILTYDHSYLQLFMLNNGKRRVIYDN